MSDDELDQEWKPSNRPQSTMARSFSLALNDLFKIDNSLADLDAAVSEKKQKVSSQTSELEELEARLKATEERLKAASNNRTSPSNKSGRSSPRPRPALGDNTFTQNPASPTRQAPSPLNSEFNRAPSRPGTAARPKTGDRPQSGWRNTSSNANVPPMPGALPPTPGASEGEYEPESDGADAHVEDGDVPPPVPPTKNNARNEH